MNFRIPSHCALLLAVATTAPTAFGAWLFTSFHGNGDGLRYSHSDDARLWHGLDSVFLKPEIGGKLLRDPHILRGPDGTFHLVWTTGWKDLGIGYASSKDLVNWSPQRFLPFMTDTPDAKTCWAPETFYDAKRGEFVLMWSSSVGAKDEKLRAYFSVTKDFQTFSQPRVLFDPGFNNLDTTMVARGGAYRIVFKEADDQSAKKWGAIRSATAPTPTGPFTIDPAPVIAGERVEGPTLVTTGDTTLLYVDYYADKRYGVRETRDWKTWTDATASSAVVPGQRHGTIFEVSAAELANVVAASSKSSAADAARRAPDAVLPGVNADPHIARFGDRYYLYPTTDGTTGWLATSFRAWSSPDLVTWKDEGVILDLPRDLTWADVRAWAPAIATKNGKYYYYFSAAQSIGVAVADTPAGPFKDPLGKPLVAKADYQRMQTIDPMVFVDDDGSAYLYFGQGRCKVVKLNDDMISFDPAQVRDVTPPRYNEGPFMLKRGGKYYLSWSEFDTRSPLYSVAYGVGDSPLGPFVKAEINPILKQSGVVKGAGHHSILQLPGRDEWVIAYHRFKIPDGNGYNRETCLSPLRFDSEGRIEPVDVFSAVPATPIPTPAPR